jgi:hypothetical protein
MFNLLWPLLGTLAIVYIGFYSSIDPAWNIAVLGGTIALTVGPATIFSFLSNSTAPANFAPANAARVNTPVPSPVNLESTPTPSQSEYYDLFALTRQLTFYLQSKTSTLPKSHPFHSNLTLRCPPTFICVCTRPIARIFPLVTRLAMAQECANCHTSKCGSPLDLLLLLSARSHLISGSAPNGSMSTTYTTATGSAHVNYQRQHAKVPFSLR